MGNTRSLSFELPFPPSVNHYWGSRVAGKIVMMYIKAKGKAFRADVEAAVGSVEALQGPLEVDVELYLPDRRKRDVDNYGKALLDALTHSKVWEDDEQVYILHVEKILKDRHDFEKGRCLVHIKEIGNDT